ncbi:Retrovirus-related Pol polyprotein from transposon gypsy [Trichinella spiralis]|uniref:RNA-directed DNA polymerase n=1 Tax=Trichinella spiralis TaxID=6334 RepID=A0A0V1AVA5_TRISP|nr:Retrovirus-related Pol polyprotein from transposon gypsy [Trichinella spiralis]
MYLGHVVTQHGVGTDPEKTAAVQEWPTPQCVREVRRFLGLASYYRRFVRNFTGVANPLHTLIKKGEKWRWCPKEKEALARLKHALVNPPILCHPHFDRTFLVDVDASKDAIGAVLFQQGEQGPPGWSRTPAARSHGRSGVTARRGGSCWPYLRDRLPAGWKNWPSSTLRWSIVPGRGTRTQMRCPVALADSAGPVMTNRMFTWQLWRYSQPVPLGGGRRKTRSSCRSGSESRRRNGHHWLQMGLWMKSLWSQRGRIVLQEGTVVAGHPEAEHPGNPYGHPQPTDRGLFRRSRNPGESAPALLMPPAAGRRGRLVLSVSDVRRSRDPNKKIASPHAAAAVAGSVLLPNAEARTVATALVNGVFCRYGAPETLHSDHSRNFESELVKEVCQLFGVTKTQATAYHPHEGVHRPSGRLGCPPRSSTAGLLGQCSLHNRSHSQSRCVQQRALAASGPDVRNAEGGTSENRRGKAGREQRRQKAWKDRKAYGPVYKPGDQVWMQLLTKTKLGAYWDGPYQVQRKLDWNTYRVEKMGGGREQMVKHFHRLKPYHGTHQGEGTQGRQREKKETRRPAWLQDFIQDAESEHGTCSS